MDKGVRDRQISQKFLIPQPLSGDNRSNYKIPQSVAKTKNNEESNESNVIDYKNISLTMTGEISSGYIHRNSLTQKQPNITFIEDTEDDDEQFILNMKTIIDKNYKTQDKENVSLRDLQSKSYLSRKKKCVFSDEDQTLMKRFKRSVDESKASSAASRKSSQSSNKQVVSVSNHGCSTIDTPQTTPIVQHNDNDMNFGGNTNEMFFHAASTMRNNDQRLAPGSAQTVEIVEFEKIIYHEMYLFTPPQRDDS
ncbi:uncharacterized protein LOC143893180 [Temnothorax americanus]|uniref:uncharacterized protein LOC143893180 n=1 Tax=Temnothorax americanus TaxID=1964332 RepID=UPI004068673C